MAEIRKINCERRLEHNIFTLKLGTTNKLNPIVVYVEGKTFISPLYQKNSYNKDLNEIKRKLTQSIKTKIISTTSFTNDFILDFQISSTGIKCRKKSNLTFEVLLKQPLNNILKLTDVRKELEPHLNNVLEDLKEAILEHDFSIHKSKKIAE